jgi:putative tricarboxylic transport membrane protein
MKEFSLIKDRVGGLIFLLTGFYGLIYSRSLPMGRWNEPGPGAFPFGLAVLLAFSGIMIITRTKSNREEKQMGKEGAFPRNLITPLLIVLLTLGFILTLERLGYVASVVVYLFILFLGICRYKFLLAAGMAGVFGLGSWYFFVKVLGVQLPLSFWGI